MNKSRAIFKIALFLSIIILTACEKQVCSYCGEEKYCEEYKIIDTTRYICKECMDDPNITTSGNVVAEYQAPPLEPSDFGVGSDRNKTQNQQTDNTNASTENSNYNYNSSENSSDVTFENGENNDYSSDTNINNDISNASNDQVSNNSQKSKDQLLGEIAASLASANMQLSPDSSAEDAYGINFSTGEYAGVKLQFKQGSNGKPALSICKYGSDSDSAEDTFKSVCVYSSLAFINSNDYDGSGSTIYTSTKGNGSFESDACNFTYNSSPSSNESEGAPLAEFMISY